MIVQQLVAVAFGDLVSALKCCSPITQSTKSGRSCCVQTLCPLLMFICSALCWVSSLLSSQSSCTKQYGKSKVFWLTSLYGGSGSVDRNLRSSWNSERPSWFEEVFVWNLANKEIHRAASLLELLGKKPCIILTLWKNSNFQS